MRARILSLLLALCMLFEQTALFAQPYAAAPKRPALPTAAADHTATAIENAVRKQIAQSSSALLQAKRLERKACESLKKQDLPAFFQQEKQLNDFLISQLTSPLIESRLFALEMLLSHVQEGLVLQKDAQRAFLTVQRQLQTQKTCKDKQCQAVGLSALLLASSLFTQSPLVLPQDEPKNLPQGERQRLTNFFLALLKNDYGSVQANNAVAPYLLRALGFAGGASAVRQAEDYLIEQSKRIDVLWGAAQIPGHHWYLNRYDVANLPAQKAAMQVLAGLGEEGKKVLQYYAAQNRGLAAYTHANIELAYLGKSPVPVQKNLQRLYCDQVWHLKSDADFDLKKQLAYAYGQGRAPAYVYASQDASACRVTVPQQPDPRLKNAELTQRLMGEILFIGGGEFLNVLLKARKVRLAVQALKSKLTRQGGKAAAGLAPKPAVLPRPVPVAVATEKVAPSAAKQAPKAIQTTANYLEQDKIVLLNNMQQLEHRAQLSSGQQNHLKYLQGKLNSRPVTTYSLHEIKQDFSAIPGKKYNGFAVFGAEMESYGYMLDEMKANFMTRGIGYPMDGYSLGRQVSKESIVEEFLQYGKMSDDIFVRWNMHGNLNHDVWHSYLAENNFMDMEEIASIFQQVIEAGSAKTVTLYLDSCFPGAAFKQFLNLPEKLRANINLFAPGGWRELRYSLPMQTSFVNKTPLQYAKEIWQSTLATNSLAGKAYVNGKVYFPLAQAAHQAQKNGKTLFSSQMQGLLRLTSSSSNDSFFDLIDGLKDLGLPIFQQGQERALYMFLPKPNMIIEHQGAYQITVPDYLLQPVRRALEDMPF